MMPPWGVNDGAQVSARGGKLHAPQRAGWRASLQASSMNTSRSPGHPAHEVFQRLLRDDGRDRVVRVAQIDHLRVQADFRAHVLGGAQQRTEGGVGRQDGALVQAGQHAGRLR